MVWNQLRTPLCCHYRINPVGEFRIFAHIPGALVDSKTLWIGKWDTSTVWWACNIQVVCALFCLLSHMISFSLACVHRAHNWARTWRAVHTGSVSQFWPYQREHGILTRFSNQSSRYFQYHSVQLYFWSRFLNCILAQFRSRLSHLSLLQIASWSKLSFDTGNYSTWTSSCLLRLILCQLQSEFTGIRSSFRVEAKFRFVAPFKYVDHCRRICCIPERRIKLEFGFNTKRWSNSREFWVQLTENQS